MAKRVRAGEVQRPCLEEYDRGVGGDRLVRQIGCAGADRRGGSFGGVEVGPPGQKRLPDPVSLPRRTDFNSSERSRSPVCTCTSYLAYEPVHSHSPVIFFKPRPLDFACSHAFCHSMAWHSRLPAMAQALSALRTSPL